MNRSGNLVAILLFALVVLGTAGWYLFGRSPAVVIEDATPALLAESREGAAPATSAAQKPRETAHAEPAAARVAVEKKEKLSDDPEFDAAMCGFTGRVVTHDHKPVAGCSVKLFRFDPQVMLKEGLTLMSDAANELDLDIESGETTTAADGRFTLKGVWPRSIHLLLAAQGQETPTAQMVDRTPGPGELCDLGDIALRDGAILTGTVVDGSGAPVKGATVRAIDLPGTVLGLVPVERIDPEGAIFVRAGGREFGSGPVVFEMPSWVKKRWEQLPIPRALTDADGKFRLVGVEGGTSFVAVTAKGFASFVNASVKVKAGQEKDLGTIKIDEGEQLQGRVVDQNGKPIAGAEVLVAQKSGGAPVDFATRAGASDAQGKFQCAGFKPGQVTGAARRTARDPWTFAEGASVNSDLVIKLPALATLTLRLVSKASLPITAPKLRLIPNQLELPFVLLGIARPIPVQGRVEILEGGLLRVRDLPLGPYMAFIECAGHALARADLTLDADKQVDVGLDARRSFEVRVVDAQNKPVRRAAVYVMARGDGDREHMPTHAGTTGADGKLVVNAQFHANAFGLSAMHPLHGSVHKRVDLPLNGPLELQMAAPGAIDGTLTDKGQVPEPGKWMVEVELGWWEGREWGAMPDLARWAVPDKEGKFKVSALAPGKYRLSPQQPMSAIRSPGSLVSSMTKMRRWFETVPEVEVAAGQTATITIDTENKPLPPQGPSARITGTVMINGAPGVGFAVQSWGNQQVNAKVDAGGRFDLGLIKAGSVHLQLLDETAENPWRSSLWSTYFELKANEDKDLRIDLQTGSVAGTVYGSDGRPLAGVAVHGNVQLKGDTPDGGRWANLSATSDPSGRFELPKVPVGKCTLNAESKEHGRSASQSVDVTASVPTSGVELRMRNTVVARGKVDLTTATLRDSTWIHFQPTRAGASESFVDGRGTSCKSDGTFVIEGLFPGTYKAQLHATDTHLESESDIVVGEQGASDLVIRFKKREMQPRVEKKKEK